MQWWLNDLWLTGGIDVGIECMPPAEKAEAVGWFSGAVNSQFASRFCTNKPAVVDPPPNPGGPCVDNTRRRAVRR